MTKRTLFAITLIFGLVLSLMGQERRLNRGNEQYEEYSFVPAIDIYQKVLDKGFESGPVPNKEGSTITWLFNEGPADGQEGCAGRHVVVRTVVNGVAFYGPTNPIVVMVA